MFSWKDTGFAPMVSSPPTIKFIFRVSPQLVEVSSSPVILNAVDKKMRNNLYIRLVLVGGELDHVESMWGRNWWGRTDHGVKPEANFSWYAQLSKGLCIY